MAFTFTFVALFWANLVSLTCGIDSTALSAIQPSTSVDKVLPIPVPPTHILPFLPHITPDPLLAESGLQIPHHAQMAGVNTVPWGILPPKFIAGASENDAPITTPISDSISGDTSSTPTDNSFTTPTDDGSIRPTDGKPAVPTDDGSATTTVVCTLEEYGTGAICQTYVPTPASTCMPWEPNGTMTNEYVCWNESGVYHYSYHDPPAYGNALYTKFFGPDYNAAAIQASAIILLIYSIGSGFCLIRMYYAGWIDWGLNWTRPRRARNIITWTTAVAQAHDNSSEEDIEMTEFPTSLPARLDPLDPLIRQQMELERAIMRYC